MPLSDYLQEGKHGERENIKTVRPDVSDRRSYALKNKILIEREISAHICEAYFPGPPQHILHVEPTAPHCWVISNAFSHLLKHSWEAKKSYPIQNLKGVVKNQGEQQKSLHQANM